jgi:hypothetical protein
VSKRKVLLWTAVGGLAALGAVTLSVNVAHHLGWSQACVTSREWSVSSPHDSGVAIFTMARCGAKRNEVRVRLTASGKSYQLLSAIATSPEPDVTIDWQSATKMELRYPRELRIEFPPGLHEARHFFGDVEVAYVPL